jgi:hypothetical protein
VKCNIALPVILWGYQAWLYDCKGRIQIKGVRRLVKKFGVQEKVNCVQKKLCVLRFFVISFLDSD